jgi:hypothetical protein
VVQTKSFGNRVFSCFEGERPWLFGRYDVTVGGAVDLRPEFLESCVPGSLFVFSAVSSYPMPISAVVDGERLITGFHGHRRCVATIIVAGVHKDFPDWDMPRVSDEAMARSRRFFNQEWTGPLFNKGTPDL